MLASCIERVKSFGFFPKISGQHFSANINHEKKAVVDWQGERGRTQESLQLPWSLNAACVSTRRYGLGRRSAVLYCTSCWWVKSNCGCTQTCSSKLLLLDDTPLLLHVAVELLLLLLLLLWSRKELALAYGNCCTDDEEDIGASKKTKPLAIALSLPLAPHDPRASQ